MKGTYLGELDRVCPLMLCDDAYTLGKLPQTDPGQREKGDEELVEIGWGRTKKASSRGQRSPIQSMRSWPTGKIWVHTEKQNAF